MSEERREPPNLVLERNLQRLLRASYRPVLPDPAFEDELRVRFLARATYLARARRGAMDPAAASRWATLGGGRAVAALLLVTLGFVAWVATRPGRAPGDGPAAPVASATGPGSILARGLAALRRGDEDPWREAASPVLPPDAARPLLELASPAGSTLRLAASSPLELELRGEARVRLEHRRDGTRLEHLSGELRVAPRSPGDHRIDTAEGSLELLAGRLTLAPPPGGPGLLLLLEATGESPASARPVGASEPLPAQRTLLLLAGRWSEERGERSAAAPADPPPAVGPPAVGPAAVGPEEPAGPVLLLRALDGTTGEPLPGARVWTRERVPLPQVALAVLHGETDADGTLRAVVEPGDLALLVEAPGRAAWRLDSLAFAGTDRHEVEAVLEPGGSVQGFVVDRATGAPVSGARVIAELDQPHQILPLGEDPGTLGEAPLASATSDAAGAFTLPHLSAGRHLLRIDHPGHAAAWSPRFQVESGGEVRLAPVALGPGASVLGRVETSDGLPQAGAEVIASRMDMSGASLAMSYGHAMTAPDGTYRIDDLPAGYFVVLVAGPEATDEGRPERMQQILVRPGAEQRVDFLGATRRPALRGRLLDAAGRPLADVGLSLMRAPRSSEYEDWSAALTGPGGEFEFLDVPPGPHGLYLGREMATELVLVHEFDMPGSGADLDLDVRLADTLLSGRVRGPDGEALVRLDLVVLREGEDERRWFVARVPSAGDGTFRIAGLAPGDYVVGALGEESLLAPVVSRDVRLFEGEPVELELDLPLGGRVEVHVEDEEGRPVVGARVRVVDAGGGEARVSAVPSTDPAGDFSSPGLAAGTWRIEVSHPDHLSAVREVEVRTGEVARLRLTLRRR